MGLQVRAAPRLVPAPLVPPITQRTGRYTTLCSLRVSLCNRSSYLRVLHPRRPRHLLSVPPPRHRGPRGPRAIQAGAAAAAGGAARTCKYDACGARVSYLPCTVEPWGRVTTVHVCGAVCCSCRTLPCRHELHSHHDVTFGHQRKRDDLAWTATEQDSPAAPGPSLNCCCCCCPATPAATCCCCCCCCRLNSAATTRSVASELEGR